MKVLAPGKLILSGEHAVVYGHPALAVATNRYVTTTITPHESSDFSFDLTNLSYQNSVSFAELSTISETIKKNYQRFLKNEITIRDVLQTPAALVKAALNLFCETFRFSSGFKIKVDSTIPIGCGMGSSAATIISVLYALDLKRSVEKTQLTHQSNLLDVALQVENFQHGYSSGLDLQLSLHGGSLYFENKQIHRRQFSNLPLYLINTGLPQNTTGECVSTAAKHFKLSKIGNDFAAVTSAMDVAFQTGNLLSAQEAVKANHKLLTEIGVVPQAVQQFISEVEKENGAAKICGAGAVSGNAAGATLVMIENKIALTQLCERYNYALLPLEIETEGVRVV